MAIPDVRSVVSAEEWQRRVELAALYRMVARMGWDDLVFTHLSARAPGGEHHFLINPFGLLFSEITASNLVKINLAGKIVLDNGYPVNGAGFTIHAAVHGARDDAQCVMHLHTPDGNAVSAHAEGLMPLNQTALVVRADVAYHDYEGLAFDLREQQRLVADLGTKGAMILRNHGTLALGATVGEAFTRMYFLERACSMQVRTLAGGVKLHLPSPASQEKTAQQALYALQPSANGLVWPAMLRLLDREEPDYKT